MSGCFRWKTCFPSVSLIVLFLMMACSTPDMENPRFNWIRIPSLPPATGDSLQVGLAGAIAGSFGNILMMAGGANFRDGLPWKGGTKEYHNDIFLLSQRSDRNFQWEVAALKLPVDLAYPASVSVPEGVMSIGGENQNGLLKEVFLFSLSDGELRIKNLPDLPLALSSAGAARIGSTVYLAGGLGNEGAASGFYCLDLEAPASGWKKLPDLPVPLSHAVVVSQKDESGWCIFVIGGRKKSGECSTFFSSTWKYSLNTGQWIRDAVINFGGEPVALSAGTGIPAGKNSIVLFGGDQGMIFNQTERLNSLIEKTTDPHENRILLERKDSLLTNHPGFPRRIMVYNTISRQWKTAGEIPGPAPVTTTAIEWNGLVIIPSGEIRPGIRTPEVIAAEIIISK